MAERSAQPGRAVRAQMKAVMSKSSLGPPEGNRLSRSTPAHVRRDIVAKSKTGRDSRRS